MGTSHKKGGSKGRGNHHHKGGASGENTGRWTDEERALFEEGLRLHGKQWKHIADMIPTRTIVQIRTHAQKHFLKLAKTQPDVSTSIAHCEPSEESRSKKPMANRTRQVGSHPSSRRSASTKPSDENVSSVANATRRASSSSSSGTLSRSSSSSSSNSDDLKPLTTSSGRKGGKSSSASSSSRRQQPKQQHSWASRGSSGNSQAPATRMFEQLPAAPPQLMIKIPSVVEDFGGMPSLLPPVRSADYRHGLPHLLEPAAPHSHNSNNKPSPTSVADCAFLEFSSVEFREKNKNKPHGQATAALPSADGRAPLLLSASSSFDSRCPSVASSFPAYPHGGCVSMEPVLLSDEDDPYALYAESAGESSSSSSSLYQIEDTSDSLSSSSSSSSSCSLPVGQGPRGTPRKASAALPDPAGNKRTRHTAPPPTSYSYPPHQHHAARLSPAAASGMQQQLSEQDEPDAAALFEGLGGADVGGCLDFGMLDDVLGLLNDDDDDDEALIATAVLPLTHQQHAPHVPMMVGPPA